MIVNTYRRPTFTEHDGAPRLRWAIVIGTLLLVATSGLGLAYSPLLVAPVLAIAVLSVLLTLQDRIAPFFLVVLGLLLFGYVFQGKSVAYLGIPPLYLGELVLLLGILALVIGQFSLKLGKLEVVLLMFIGFGLLRTVPNLSGNGLLALRDAAVWYYASFAIIIAILFTVPRWLVTIRWLQRLMLAIVVWFSVMPILFRLLSPSIPTVPGSTQPMLSVTKPGDRAVFLVVIAAFAVSGLSAYSHSRRLNPHVFWGFWLTSAFLIAAWNRGGMMSILIGMLGVILLMPSREWFRPITIGAISLSLLLIWNPTISTGGYRPLSTQQLVVNFVSVFSDDTENLQGVQGTKDWRLNWWSDIYEDTVRGDDFWMGKGFGVNLAEEYGYQLDAQNSLRSPHNVHMTILARMGVPGLALWAALQLGFANSTIRAYRSARRARDQLWSGTFALVFASWLAVMVNSTFDVYLEGPQGAIPFWCLFGVGLGALRLCNLPSGVAPSSRRRSS